MDFGRAENLKGKRFGKWKVIERLPNKPNKTAAIWLCRCKCGTESPVAASSLKSGASTKCTRCRNDSQRG